MANDAKLTIDILDGGTSGGGSGSGTGGGGGGKGSGGGTAKPWDAMEEARKAMLAAEKAGMVHRARLEIDPAFAKGERAKERKEEAAKLQSMAQVLSMSGMPTAGKGLSGVAGMMGASGPAAAITGGLMVFQAAMDGLTKGIQGVTRMASAMASLDPHKVERGFVSMVENVPLVGGLLGALGHGILDVSDALTGSARKLARFSGPLSAEVAMQDVRSTLRDLQRAQEFGPQLVEAMRAREALDIEVQKLIDESMPDIINTTNELLALMIDIAPLIQGLTETAIGFVRWFVPESGRAAEMRQRIADNTRRPGSNLEEFFGIGIRSPRVASAEESLRTTPRSVPQPAFPGF